MNFTYTSFDMFSFSSMLLTVDNGITHINDPLHTREEFTFQFPKRLTVDLRHMDWTHTENSRLLEIGESEFSTRKRFINRAKIPSLLIAQDRFLYRSIRATIPDMKMIVSYDHVNVYCHDVNVKIAFESFEDLVLFKLAILG